MKSRVRDLLGKNFDQPVNCFCLSQGYFQDVQFKKVSADEMLQFVTQNFQQIPTAGYETLFLVWSRTSFEIPNGEIQALELFKKEPGFPFGLVLEHSFVLVENDFVFQKPDPKLSSVPELIDLQSALAPYVELPGFELTYHQYLA